MPTLDFRRHDEAVCRQKRSNSCRANGWGLQPRSKSACAVWLRYTGLRLLARQGFPAEWQHNTEFDDAVYRVAATIPKNGLHLESEAFVQRLRGETAALNSSLDV